MSAADPISFSAGCSVAGCARMSNWQSVGHTANAGTDSTDRCNSDCVRDQPTPEVVAFPPRPLVEPVPLAGWSWLRAGREAIVRRLP